MFSPEPMTGRPTVTMVPSITSSARPLFPPGRVSLCEDIMVCYPDRRVTDVVGGMTYGVREGATGSVCHVAEVLFVIGVTIYLRSDHERT